ncbi:hypothetical protein PVAP13_5KG130887 [Panicum virgatum]|uniref:Uncharacterized protein n=1 Tax=Panicum virgatum TaxID=38727 RepID=A0A8T0SG94_PANVG|nr:hypothetical protein PVAP13_5KG130887 [Panicum virgatum]
MTPTSTMPTRCSTNVPTPTSAPIINAATLATSYTPPATTTLNTTIFISAMDNSTSSTPTRCSIDCPSRGTNELLPMLILAPATSSMTTSSATALASLNVEATLMHPVVEFQDMRKPLPTTLMGVTSKPSSTSMDYQVVFHEIQQRYITSFAPAYYVGVAQLGTVTEVLEGLRSQSAIMLGPLPAHVFDIGPGSPAKEHSYILLLETVSLCFNLLLPLSRDWVTVHQRQAMASYRRRPGIQSTGVQLRPTPWPSFGCDTVVQLVQALSYSWHMDQFAKLLHDDIRLLHLGPESSLVPMDIAITLELYWLVLTYYHE